MGSEMCIRDRYQHLLETHFPGSKNESESRSSQEINDMRCHKSRWLSSRSLDILTEIVTVDRIKWAISTMSPVMEKIRMVGPWENINLLVILLPETRRRREHGRATPTLAGEP